MSVAVSAEIPKLKSTTAARRSKLVGRVLTYGVLGFFVLFYLLPLVVMILTSFKTMHDIQTGTVLSLPNPLTVEPWTTAWSKACIGVECVGLHSFYRNTVIMAVPAVGVSTLIGALNGYALTQLEFPYPRAVFGIILLGAFFIRRIRPFDAFRR